MRSREGESQKYAEKLDSKDKKKSPVSYNIFFYLFCFRWFFFRKGHLYADAILTAGDKQKLPDFPGRWEHRTRRYLKFILTKS